MYQIGTEGGFLPAVAAHPNGIPCPWTWSDPPATPPTPTAPSTCCWHRRSAPTSSSTSRAEWQVLHPLQRRAGAFPRWRSAERLFHRGPGLQNTWLSGGAPTTAAGHGPNTRTIMKIVVGNSTASAGAPAQPDDAEPGLKAKLHRRQPGGPAAAPAAASFNGADAANPGRSLCGTGEPQA